MDYEDFMSGEEFSGRLRYGKQELHNKLSEVDNEFTRVQIEGRYINIESLKNYVLDWSPHELTLPCDSLIGFKVYPLTGYTRYKISEEYSGDLNIYGTDLTSSLSKYVLGIGANGVNKFHAGKLMRSFFQSKEAILDYLMKIGFNKKYKIIYNGDKVKMEDFLN